MRREIGILVRGEGVEPHGAGGGASFNALAGFEVKTLPLVNQDDALEQSHKGRGGLFSQQANLKQWADFISALHSMALKEADAPTSYAVQFTATPRHNLGAKVSLHFFLRTTAATAAAAHARAAAVAEGVKQLFPKGDLRAAAVEPTPLDKSELAASLWHGEDEIQLVTVSKFVERLSAPFGPAFADMNVRIPHPFLPGADSLLAGLVEVLEQSSEKVCVRCEIEPTRLTAGEEEYVELLGHLFGRAALEGERQYELVAAYDNRERLNRVGDDAGFKSWPGAVTDATAGRASRLTPHQLRAADRGLHVFRSLLEAQAQLFNMRVTLACAGGSPVPGSAAACVLAALHSHDNEGAALGWKTPALEEPGAEKAADAALDFRWMARPRWLSNPELLRWDSFATVRETLAAFHLPALHGPAVGVETTFVPFQVPAEFLRIIEAGAGRENYVTLGYAYHRNVCHDPPTVGPQRALPYRLPLRALTHPMLISGSPGGGKTNWLFCLLIDLWKEHQTPWCVIDPSGGQEYRYLLAEESLRDRLVVYTVGDNLTSPLRFNPFAVPPSGRGGTNTVRSHAAKLISCFKSASDMWTPLPEIFHEAVCRAYANFGWAMDDTYETGKARGLRFPSFSDFARALDEELDEVVIPNYGRGTEAAGVLLGGTRDRVNNIVNQLGHVLDVADDSADFFQNLLSTPCVLELGGLGPEDTISLVMSFLLVQLAGHTEYASRAGSSERRQRLLCVEEAHILLSGDGPNKSNQTQQGNPRAKAAEDFGRLLLEFRKFGSGVVLVDQRIASLIGAAVDSAYLNLMFRTVAPASFNHLKAILRLDARQVEYAHTQLDEGRCILMDRASGRPVLIRQRNALDELRGRQLTFEEFVERAKRNALAASLVTPEHRDARPVRDASKGGRVFQPRSSS